MQQEVSDEVTSINSIYGEGTVSQLQEESCIFALKLPSQPDISLRLKFPPKYPGAPPSILGTQHVGSAFAKGTGTEVVDLVRRVLAEVYTAGVPCLYDLLEESSSRLQDLVQERRSKDENSSDAQKFNGAPGSPILGPDLSHGSQLPAELGEVPPWILSDTVIEKKSVFLARAAEVTSTDQARRYLAHLLTTDKKAAKATHNITAWRIRGGNGIQYQDCDDDGETAAGGRVLHLLELMDVWNIMVVVTRWYGGILLGPDRFRIINQTARDAVAKAGLVPETGLGKGSGKKRDKRGRAQA
ncbi:UPF0029-domain-containing protein [Piedraia hortae CBS 480.64]|uniref:UPF0029-domain-containing protein n=1 Tax=Piedraia hortae CBS 480.64 TaxID=1314780 RepID=A0A6A7C7P4_9PEZI|nr:UPF0029-domain-containing protein [Piedraia hortae CBS 480.64]